MDDNRASVLGLGSRNSLRELSPYLNIDPSYLQTQTPEYLTNPDIERKSFETYLSGIGTSLFVGAGAGATYGLYDGVRSTAMAGMTGKLRKIQILNHTLKSGTDFVSTM